MAGATEESEADVTAKPMNVVSGPMFLCGPRGGDRIEHLHCTACGWWGKPNDPDDGGLFPEHPEHTEFECRRRQADPHFRHEQDQKRRDDAGLPDVMEPPNPR